MGNVKRRVRAGAGRRGRATVIAAILIYIAGVVLISAVLFAYSQRRVMREIDANLRRAAEAVPYLLPAGYLDRARGVDAVSDGEYLEINRALDRFTRILGVDYLYTGAVISNQLYVTGFSLPPEEEEAEDNLPYFMRYDQAGEAFQRSLGDTNLFYETYEDQWGKRRGATVTVLTRAGNACLVGADFDLSFVSRALFRDLYLAIAQGLFYLLLAVPIVLSFNGVYRRLAHHLQKVNTRLREDMARRREAEAALQHAYDELKQVDRLKNGVVHLFTHEMRTPLNGIKGFSELLLADRSLANEQREYAEMIHTAGLRLIEFTDKAILIARFKAGSSICPEIRNVNKEILAAIADITPNLREQIQLAGSDSLVWAADWPFARRAVGMVVDNALKHSHPGDPVVVSYDAGQGELQIDVSDSGQGIDSECIGRIFDEFGVDDVQHHGEGQHLSLALCRHICQAHGGDVFIESQIGEGARVRLTFAEQCETS